MKIRSLLCSALIVAAALALSACVKDQPTPSAPGPHQGNGVHDGKDQVMVRSPGPHQ